MKFEDQPITLNGELDRYKNQNACVEVEKLQDSDSLVGVMEEGYFKNQDLIEESLQSSSQDPGVLQMLKDLWFLAGPSMLTYLAGFLGIFIQYMVVKQYSDSRNVNALLLANSFGNCLCLSVGIGLAGGLDTLCSQAIGVKQYQVAGLWLQRSRIILCVAWIPLAILLTFGKHITSALHQKDADADLVGLLLKLLVIDFFFEYQRDALQRFVILCGRPAQAFINAFLRISTMILLLYLFTVVKKDGARGAILAMLTSSIIGWLHLEVYLFTVRTSARKKMSSSSILAPLISPSQPAERKSSRNSTQPAALLPDVNELAYEDLNYHDISNSYPREVTSDVIDEAPKKESNPSIIASKALPASFDVLSEPTLYPDWELKRVLSGWKLYLTYAIPSTLMLCFEWWAFEIDIILPGIISREHSIAAGASYNIILLNYVLPMGMATGVSAYVGRFISDGNIRLAKKYFRVGVCSTFMVDLVIVSILLIMKKQVAKFFANEPVVEEYIYNAMYPIAVYMLLDSLSGTMLGCIKGLGRQRISALFNFIGFYVFALPCIAISLFILKWHIRGLWMAACLGPLIQGIAYSVITFGIDWSSSVARARKAVVQSDKDVNLAES